MSLTRTIVPDLLPHGAHIRAEYADGAWGESTDAARPAAKLDGTLQRFRKDRPASDTPQALGWIKATYPDAIEFSGSKQQTEGGIMIGAFFGILIGIFGISFGVYGMLTPFLPSPIELNLFDYLFYIPLGGLVLAGAVAGTAYAVLMPLRRVWRVPRDLPVIFDRKARKVYRLVLDVQPGLAGLFKTWPIKACAYDWDLLDAEHDASSQAVGKTIMRLHRLVFLVRKSADDPTIIDHFEIGNGMAQSESLVAPMWEHIRRFMEDNGPHLPHPSEPLDSRPPEKPTWWQACGQAGPFGSRYLWWWENHFWLTLILYHGLAGITLGLMIFILIGSGGNPAALLFLMGPWIVLSMNWGQGTGIWLLAHTSLKVDWPAAVYEAIGKATRRGEGW